MYPEAIRVGSKLVPQLQTGELTAGVLNDLQDACLLRLIYTEVGIFSCTTLHGCFSSELQCVECAVSCAPHYKVSYNTSLIICVKGVCILPIYVSTYLLYCCYWLV